MWKFELFNSLGFGIGNSETKPHEREWFSLKTAMLYTAEYFVPSYLVLCWAVCPFNVVHTVSVLHVFTESRVCFNTIILHIFNYINIFFFFFCNYVYVIIIVVVYAIFVNFIWELLPWQLAIQKFKLLDFFSFAFFLFLFSFCLCSCCVKMSLCIFRKKKQMQIKMYVVWQQVYLHKLLFRAYPVSRWYFKWAPSRFQKDVLWLKFEQMPWYEY